jgi:tRNA(Met) cytidine acetyltransferase
VNLPKQLFHWLEQRQSKLCHRQLLVITGQEEWTTNAAVALLGNNDIQRILWVTDTQVEYQNISIKNYRSKLGHEYDWVVLNCFSGFRANAAMALSGTIKANGLMVILCPELLEWPNYDDPEQINRISYGYQHKNSTSFFIQHLISSFYEDSSVAILSAEKFSGKAFFVKDSLGKERYCEQEEAVKNICKVALGHRNRPLLITADRGRGKSSALGIAAAKLMQTPNKTIWLTAPQISATEQVFKHAKRALPEGSLIKNQFVYNTSSLTFKPIDALLQNDESADLLLVDEAAALPIHMLLKLAAKFSRIVFSSTVHGYEGSGRGFELKFRQALKKLKPEYKTMHISHPIRWYAEDPLEAFWFNTFFHQSVKQKKTLVETNDPIEFRYVSSQALLEQTNVLADVFKLLIEAHYQTSPDDLQRLLDSPEQKCFILSKGTTIIGVAQIIQEGGNYLTGMASDIANYSRRVRGHLVAQNLASMNNLAEFCLVKQWRISRITIANAYQRQGYGKVLLQNIEQQAKESEVAFITSAFGSNKDLLKFWYNSDYNLAKISYKPEVSSGEHSCICLKPLNVDFLPIFTTIIQHFSDELLFNMDKDLQNLATDILLLILRENKHNVIAPPSGMVDQFIEGDRPFISAKRVLTQSWLAKVNTTAGNNHSEQLLLVATLLQNKSFQQIYSEFNLMGKKQIEEKIRCAVLSTF